jgi:serine/threonine protein kinase
VTNVERLRRADEIIQAALECGNGELAALLDAECAGDALLRTEVESLLGYRARAKNFIETPAFALGAELFAGGNYCDDLGDEGACVEGRRIGSYQVVREIGRGGMGAVYLSERADGEFRQQVAVKIIRQTLAGAETRRHFKRERQILASLNHPNIARLLDGGVSADGEPFLAMEYVEGVRIDEYADAHGLSTIARLGLFRQVCAAVQYAHQNLIIHRDLKPSNILVTNEGVPKLLDFGIAKLLDPNHAGDQTRTEMRAFTPDYAAPEQVAGAPVTTASDVYSLGVLLDDLLRASSAGRGARRRFPAAGGREAQARQSLRTSRRTAKAETEGRNPPRKLLSTPNLKTSSRWRGAKTPRAATHPSRNSPTTCRGIWTGSPSAHRRTLSLIARASSSGVIKSASSRRR